MSIQYLFYLPLTIPFMISTAKPIIISDVERWSKIFALPESSILISLLTLLPQHQEFRNLYYFRLYKGNSIGRFLSDVLKYIYRPSSYLIIDLSCNIGEGLFIQHGLATIIMADIGKNCWINQQVTIGYKDKTGRPTIGDNVRITAGAKVLGKITIGDNVTIGANAVVVKDVPENCIVGGVPARIIKQKDIKVDESL